MQVGNIDGVAVHTTLAPIAVGTEVLVKLDWQRRWDHMQQHSGQHVITATAIKLFGLQTEAWNLGTELSFLELEGTGFTPEQLSELEQAVNANIRAGLAVTPRWIAPDDPELPTIRCRGLPDNVTTEIRVSEIDGLDKNLCCGTHVKTTTDLQLVKLVKAEKAKKNTRVWFVVGDRALHQLGVLFTRQSTLTAMLTVAPDLHLEQVAKISKNGREHEKAGKALAVEVAGLTANSLVSEIAAGKNVLCTHREVGDINWLKSVTNAVEPRGEALLLATVGSGDGDGGMFMLSGPEDKVKEVGPAMAKIMNGKGGGKGRFQGKVQAISKRDEAFAELQRLCGGGGGGGEGEAGAVGGGDGRKTYEQDGPEAREIAKVIPYFPFKGIPRFYDIGGFLKNATVFQQIVDIFAERYRGIGIDSVGGLDARGFVLGPPIALALGKPFFMLRKKGKMPNSIESPPYQTEYGARSGMCIPRDAVKKGERVLLIDDLVATGGTLSAGISVIEALGGKVVECACVVELKMFINPPADSGMPNRTKLFTDLGMQDIPVWALISEEILDNEAKLAADYKDDGEEH